MNRLVSLWNEILSGRKDGLYTIRAGAVIVFAALLGIFAAMQFHLQELADVLTGMALPISGILAIQAFKLKSAEFKSEPHHSETIELHLSR